jgi:hypothetical protein
MKPDVSVYNIKRLDRGLGIRSIDEYFFLKMYLPYHMQWKTNLFILRVYQAASIQLKTVDPYFLALSLVHAMCVEKTCSHQQRESKKDVDSISSIYGNSSSLITLERFDLLSLEEKEKGFFELLKNRNYECREKNIDYVTVILEEGLIRSVFSSLLNNEHFIENPVNQSDFTNLIIGMFDSLLKSEQWTAVEDLLILIRPIKKWFCFDVVVLNEEKSLLKFVVCSNALRSRRLSKLVMLLK